MHAESYRLVEDLAVNFAMVRANMDKKCKIDVAISGN